MKSGAHSGSGPDADTPRNHAIGSRSVASQPCAIELGRSRQKRGHQTPEGKPIWTRLVYAGETKIRRHIKIRKIANPFDPQWKSYFLKRAFQKKVGLACRQARTKSS